MSPIQLVLLQGYCRRRLMTGSKTERDFTGGIVYIVSGLKTYVETAVPMAAAAAG